VRPRGAADTAVGGGELDFCDERKGVEVWGTRMG